MPSPPLARVLHSLGRVQHHLHTAVVGLSAVEHGHATKPNDLTINWAPRDLPGSAREARSFILRATIVFAAEEVSSYATRVLRYLGVTLPERNIDRIRTVSQRLPLTQDYIGVAAVLVRQWRNRIIHPASSADLTAKERSGFTTQADQIASAYKGVDVSQLLGDFDNDRPTLKDATALLAMLIRFCREVDSHLAEPRSAAEVRRWLDVDDLLAEVLRLEKQSRNGGRADVRAAARQFLITSAAPIAAAYYEFGAT